MINNVSLHYQKTNKMKLELTELQANILLNILEEYILTGQRSEIRELIANEICDKLTE